MKNLGKKAGQILKVRGVAKQFEGREFPILSGIDLEIQEGEVIALAGASGSGKTTLLRILAGLEEPDYGAVYFRESKVAGPADKLIAGHEQIRLVHQHFELAHRRNVYDNIAQKLRHLHPDDQEERTLELMEVCRLSHVAAEYVEELSGGEKQRLALARTLAEEPELLLLDEPFSNLDPHLKEEIRYDLFSFIREKRLTVIMVSHDPKDALSLADKIVVLEKGKVVQRGRPEDVYYRSVSPEVAALFGRINVCAHEELLPYLKGKARNYLQQISPGSTLGLRPEIFELMPEENAHLMVKLHKLFFHGSSYEAKVEVGGEEESEGSIFLYLNLPAFFVLPENNLMGVQLNLPYINTWASIDSIKTGKAVL